jgi:hypothetical protein
MKNSQMASILIAISDNARLTRKRTAISWRYHALEA